MVMSSSFVDADSGEEIITFMWRHPRWTAGRYVKVMMLRDRETKRFIKRIKGITVSGAVVFEYPKGKRANPLYVDIKMESFIPAEYIEHMAKFERALEQRSRDVINEYFGEDVSSRARIIGYEHKSEPVPIIYPKARWFLVWHHYHNDEKEDDGVIDIHP